MIPDVTFCLMTCGELTENDCLNAIAPWRDRIILQEVRNVFPQINALKQMVDQVETPYLVPLDADIILRPDAYERIRMAIDKYAYQMNWHSILFPLYDTLTQQKILALKVLRTNIAKQIPFEESATPDVIHYRRLTDAGYISINRYLEKDFIGDHTVKGAHFCYHKYRDVYQTLKCHGWEWDNGVFFGGRTLEEKAKKHYDYFLTQYLLQDNEDYLYCIAGMLDGILTEAKNKSKSLEPGQYTVKKEFAIDEFLQWYTGRQRDFLCF